MVDKQAQTVEVSFEDGYIKLFTDAADLLEVERRTPRTETEEFDEELNNFRLSNMDKKDGPKPPEQIVNMLRRKLYPLV